MNKNWFLVMMFTGMLLLIFFLFLQVRPGIACLTNPLNYGASHMIDSRTEKLGSLMCTCNFQGSRFILDNNGSRPFLEEYIPSKQKDLGIQFINFSK